MYRTYEEWLEVYENCRKMFLAIAVGDDGYDEQFATLTELITGYRAYYDFYRNSL